MKKLSLLACGAMALALAFTSCASTPIVSSYIRTWPIGTTPEQMDEGKHWTAEDVKGEYLDELIIAFAHVDQETWGLKYPDVEPEDPKAHPFPELWDEVAKLQAKYPDLKLHLSVGGYGADGFSQMAGVAERRKLFVQAVLDVVNQKKLDGIDIDWEYPIGPDWGSPITASPEDGVNFVTLLTELREALDTVDGRHVSLSIAVPASGWFVEKNDVVALSNVVDNVKLMSYDYYGDWSNQTGHLANLYTNPADPDWGGISTNDMVNKYITAGVPANKIILGLAFYSKAWSGVEPGPNGDGLYQKYKQAEYKDGLSWSDMGPFLAEDSGYKKYVDPVAHAPYLYNGDTFISYTDKDAVSEIGAYVVEKGLGGAMVWEYGHDYKADLLPVLYNSVNK